MSSGESSLSQPRGGSYFLKKHVSPGLKEKGVEEGGGLEKRTQPRDYDKEVMLPGRKGGRGSYDCIGGP